jgi:hypothetical protein
MRRVASIVLKILTERIQSMDLVIDAAETACNSESAIKFNDVMDGILGSGKTPTDTHGLEQQEMHLRTELNDAMNEGDLSSVISIQNKLNVLPVLKRAAEIKELRQNIERANARLEEIKIEKAQLETVRGEKNKILAEKIRDTDEAGLAVRRVDFDLNLLDNDAENQRVSRRECNQRINQLTTNADAIKASRI